MAKQQGKLRLGKGSAFVKRRLLWLPQEDVVLEADFTPYPESICDHHESWQGMVVGPCDGSILASETVETTPTVNDLADLLANAMWRPLTGGTRCRPTTIRLRDNPEWEELVPHLRQLKIEVVVTEALRAWDEVVAGLFDYLRSNRVEQQNGEMLDEGGNQSQDDLLNLRLATICYPVRRQDRNKG